MTYEKPEVLDIGNAEQVVQIMVGGPDFEPSTQTFGYYDPQAL
jgi:hypothetical protein